MTLVYVLLGMGVLFVAGRLAAWAEAKEGRLGWYHWVGFGVVALWTVFVVAWIGTSVAEGYPKAAGMGALIWGGLDLVLVVLLRLWLIKTVTKGPVAVSPGARA